MLAMAVASFFKRKALYDIIILVCWSISDQIAFVRQLNSYGLKVTIICNSYNLDFIDERRVQGILYIEQNHTILNKIENCYFSSWYKWLVISEDISVIVQKLTNTRYDADITALNGDINNINKHQREVTFKDVYMHPKVEPSLHFWAHWSSRFGFRMVNEMLKLRRRQNLFGYPLRIATPVGLYSSGRNNVPFNAYLVDNTHPEIDSATKCGYETSSLLIESLNGTEKLIQTQIWVSYVENSSMTRMLQDGEADLSGSILRMLRDRIERFDFITPIWPFRVGFTYIAERSSSSSMYIEPFSAGVWWCCLGTGVLLALALRITARNATEKEGSFYSVVASCLQQDASAVPASGVGRAVFLVLSVCSMLVHAYYTSAVVSALMRAERSGPSQLRELADSKLKIAAEDYDYARLILFNVKTNSEDLDYLRRKKMTSNFYQPIERGVELIENGGTAYHAEYNGLYQHLAKRLSDNDICGLRYIDTISEVITHVVTTRRSPFTNVMRLKGLWFHEVGLANRIRNRWKMKPPGCRVSMLAVRVKFGDVAPLLFVAVLGVVLSVILLFIEVLFVKFKGNSNSTPETRRI